MAALPGQDLWEACSPDFNGNPIHVPALKEMLLIGTFVEVDDGGSIGVGRICRHGSLAASTMIINLFPTLFPICQEDEQHLPISEGPGRSMTEICQSTVMKILPVHSIRRIAFVVPALGLARSQFHWCGGMSNAYVVRLRKHPSTGFSAFSEFETCFPSQHPEQSMHASCYVERVWNGLNIVSVMLTKTLNRCSEKQGEYTSKTLKYPFFMPAAWAFIIQSVADEVTPRSHHVTISSLNVGAGLVRKKVRRSLQGTILRFETESQLAKLRSLLGASITYGTRQKQPGVEAPSLVLRENDTVNVVVGSSEASETFSRRTARQGVDLVYDGLHIQVVVRYVKYVYLVNDKGYPRDCPSRDLASIILFFQKDVDDEENDDNDNGNCNDAFIVGASFSKTGRLYTITAICGDYCKCICSAPEASFGEVSTYKLDNELSRAIIDYST
jgi:hypothetical protein